MDINMEEAMIFDTHAHYDDKAFDEDRESLLISLKDHGIGRVVNIGSSLDSCQKTIELMDQFPFIYGALGVHPSETGGLDEDSFQWLDSICGHPKCVAIGEIGLDYYWDEPEREIQKKWFVRQLALAKQYRLPVVIHSRDANKETVEILKADYGEETGGVIHCYSYSRESLKDYLDMGLYIGVGGVLTFKNGKKLKEAVEYIPLERIVLETDCPYLSPEPNRGRRNSSLNLTYVVDELARIKGITGEEVRRVTWENAVKLYRMDQ